MDRRAPVPSSPSQQGPRSRPAPTSSSSSTNSPIILAEGPPQSEALLEPMIYVKIDEEVDNSLTLVIPFGGLDSGENKITKNHCLKIRSILEDRIKCKKQLKMVLSRSLSVAHFNRLWECGSPNAAMFDWRDPHNPSRSTTFFIKRVPAQAVQRPQVPGAAGVSRGLVTGPTRGVLPSSRAPGVRTYSPATPVQFASRTSTATRGGRLPSHGLREVALAHLQSKKKKKVEVIDIDSSESEETYSDDSDTETHQKPMYLNTQQNVSVTIMKQGDTRKDPPTLVKTVPPSKPPKSSTPSNEVQKKQQTSMMVVRGGRTWKDKNLVWKLPGKTIVPAQKKLQTFFRIPNINEFQKAHFNPKKHISYEYHPLLGKGVVVAVPPPQDEQHGPPPVKRHKTALETENTVRVKKPVGRAEKYSDSDGFSSSEDDKRRLRTRQAKMKAGGQQTPSEHNKKSSTDLERRTVPVRKRVVLQEMTGSSSSSSSTSSDSDSSGSDSDSDPQFIRVKSDEEDGNKSSKRPLGKSRNPLSSNNSNIKSSTTRSNRSPPPPPPVRRYDKGYPDFAETDPNMPLRKDSEGRIYFDTTSRLKTSEYHTNEDIFVNWDKFVRNESGVGSFYKTILRHKNPLCFLMIFHLTYDEETFVPKVDRSIELCSDGSAKVFLENIDMTSIFFSYMDIRTNHDLMAMLLNLQSSYACPGAGSDLSSILICPSGDHILRNGQWFSARCKKIVFDPNHAMFKIKSRCGPCNTLRRTLSIERTEIDKTHKVLEAAERKKFKKGPKSTNTKIIRERESEPPKLQVRESLALLLKEMWRDMGLTEIQEDYPSPVDEKPSTEIGPVPEVLESSSVPSVAEEVSVKESGGAGVNLPIQGLTEVPVTSASISIPPPASLPSCVFPENSNLLFQPPPTASDTPDLLTLSDLTFTSAEINALIPEDFSSLDMMMSSSGEGSSLLFGDMTSGPYSQQQMHQPPVSYPPQPPNQNFMYSQEAMDVTNTTGSLQGSIMCSGVFGGPVNHNVAVPVGENPQVIPIATTADSSSLAGAISMSLLFPTFDDML